MIPVWQSLDVKYLFLGMEIVPCLAKLAEGSAQAQPLTSDQRCAKYLYLGTETILYFHFEYKKLPFPELTLLVSHIFIYICMQTIYHFLIFSL